MRLPKQNETECNVNVNNREKSALNELQWTVGQKRADMNKTIIMNWS